MNTVYAWFIAIAAFFGFGAEQPAEQIFFGYVEGEYVYVSYG